MFLRVLGTPNGSNPGNKWSFKLFFDFKLIDRYQSCHPWYPQIATWSFFDAALAILIAIAFASPPDLIGEPISLISETFTAVPAPLLANIPVS